MTNEQERRFLMLQNEWCDFSFIYELYGLNLREEPRFVRHFKSWAEQRGREEVFRGEGEIHRYRFETFLQKQKLLTKKWGAVRLGMKTVSLEALLNRLNEMGLVFSYYPTNDPAAFVGEKFNDDLVELFDEFRFRTFSDHNDFCLRMHQAIERNFQIGIVPEFDATSRFISANQNQWDYAHDWDAITLEPVGLQYQVWLDLGKPMNLRPDCCSVKFYFQERELLHNYVTGTSEPDMPPELVGALQRAGR